jgi:hypothetical protein
LDQEGVGVDTTSSHDALHRRNMKSFLRKPQKYDMHQDKPAKSSEN